MEDLPQPPSPQMVMLIGTGGALGLALFWEEEAPRWRVAAGDVPAEEGILRGMWLFLLVLVLCREVARVRVERWEWKNACGVCGPLEDDEVVGTRMECLREMEKSSLLGIDSARMSVVLRLGGPSVAWLVIVEGVGWTQRLARNERSSVDVCALVWQPSVFRSRIDGGPRRG